ncbi:hypothetical protein CDL15_Pgr019187 [Punica granatum]|uniref:Uncharacterized protein n=1 Tax=Punica granatum TaxID=22663 RepID=A0A218W4X5_PUNGR|nr:hypothetical protein CDL15_Pgr019187 [Punica granatum]PKI73480.1 hypothetical protein CRG98_006061 [Punica granatum]
MNSAQELALACEPYSGFALGSRTYPGSREASISTNPSSRGWVHRERNAFSLSLSTSPGIPSLDLSRLRAREHRSLDSQALGCSGGQIWGLRAMGSCGGVVATTTTMD